MPNLDETLAIVDISAALASGPSPCGSGVADGRGEVAPAVLRQHPIWSSYQLGVMWPVTWSGPLENYLWWATSSLGRAV